MPSSMTPCNAESSPPNTRRPILGVYCQIFLEKEAKHIYRQIVGVKDFEAHVFCVDVQNRDIFPLDRLHPLSPLKPRKGLFRLWGKLVRKESAFVYRGYANALAHAIRKKGIEVLHAYFGYNGVRLLPILNQLHVPLVVSFHGVDASVMFNDPQYVLQSREVFQKATLILVRSAHMGDRLIQQGCPPEKIRISRASLDLSQFAFNPKPKPAAGQPVTFLQACRLIPKKGLETLISAFSQIHTEFPHARLEIVGSGPLEATLKQQITQLGLQDKIALRGYLETPALMTAMAQADVFIHPSESDEQGNMEGIPNALIEAMALGLPVISTEHAGIPELVNHGQNGLLAPERNPDQLAQAMRTLLQAPPEQWTAFAQKGRLAVEAQHGLAQQMERLTGFYQEAIALNAGSEPTPMTSAEDAEDTAGKIKHIKRIIRNRLYEAFCRIAYRAKALRDNPKHRVQQFEHLLQALPAIEGLDSITQQANTALTVFLCADSAYFQQYGPPIIRSIAKTSPGCGIHTHLINPTSEDSTLITSLAKEFPHLPLSHTTETIAFQSPASDFPRTYFASVRFVRLAQLRDLMQTDLLALDIDSLAHRDLGTLVPRFASMDCAIRGRLNCHDHRHKFAAGFLYTRATQRTQAFLMDISLALGPYLVRQEARWFQDQRALYQAYLYHISMWPPLKLALVDADCLDWDFLPDSFVWTGKGSLKHEDTRYLAYQAEFERNDS